MSIIPRSARNGKIVFPLPHTLLLPAFVLTLLLCRCYRPGTWGARLLNCWTFGTVLLMAWNLLPLPHVGINPISSLLTGALGISGLPLTVFLNMMP